MIIFALNYSLFTDRHPEMLEEHEILYEYFSKTRKLKTLNEYHKEKNLILSGRLCKSVE